MHISKADEDSWLNRYEAGDETARMEMISKFTPMVKRQVADALRRNNIPRDMCDDLQQSASLAMVRAFEAYDRKRGCRFSTYAYRRVQAKISYIIRKEKEYLERHKLADNDTLEDYSTSLLSMYELDSDHAHLLHVLEKVLTQREFDVCRLLLENENMTNVEIGERLGITGERVRQILRSLQSKTDLRSILRNPLA